MDPLWYKDAVFYQLHVKAFRDSNDDGIGDFKGLTDTLDYVQALGVDTLWLLPFYPSPFRDDGYDISDYRGIHPSYGSLKDFRNFVREAHRRNLKVFTELVINHTSDQHPWFQRARTARPGSVARNYYVWSTTNRKYAGTRIIFTDTEKSNWAWDDEAKAYYWHRFFSHQPDLNFDNPRVVREVIAVMRYWLDMGVDGMRLDAVPYLCEREGTNNENLPETHGVLKTLRAALDESHPGKVLLAEANQWPEDVLPYFGNGDECHMAFHFPLMPRMYMSIAREDRYPITDIMRQTPDIPGNCQWAVFLRNHDELTLEMVTDSERDYLWRTFAADRRARINLGIRRRLAPLMDNDRRKIELMNSLLLSMPGTPVLYYGDEIGMGDNCFLGDRNGVRTPMQWSADRNGGFSRANPASLYLPPIMDPVYGYTAVNVEAQGRNPSSLLNWTKRMISVRRGHKAFGRGSLRFLYPTNRRVLAYLREFEGQIVLCVANLSRSTQGVELDLSEFAGKVPVEMTGPSTLPPIGTLPYFLTMPGYGFYWFLLSAEVEPPAWHAGFLTAMAEPITLVVREGFDDLTSGQARRSFERDVLPNWLQAQRWFTDRDVGLESTELLRWTELVTSRGRWLLAVIGARRADAAQTTYFVPMAVAWGDSGEEGIGGSTLARLRHAAKVGALKDAVVEDDFILALVEVMRSQASLRTGYGYLAAHTSLALEEVQLPEKPMVTRFTGEQSNTSVAIGSALVLKIIRRPQPGANAELEISQFLTETSRFANTPPLLGWIEDGAAGQAGSVLAMMHGYVPNQGDGWEWTLTQLEPFLDEASLLPPEALADRIASGALDDYLEFAAIIGRRTAEMHRALALKTGDPDFDPVPATAMDLDGWRTRALEQARRALTILAKSETPEAWAVASEPERLFNRITSLIPAAPSGWLTRVHGDYHLGQLLVSGGDIFVIDFEGEPNRPMAGRRSKDSPLRDLAVMLRSFDYAARTIVTRMGAGRPEVVDQLEPVAANWFAKVSEAFVGQYRETIAESRAMFPETSQARALLNLFMIEKACYECAYEASRRPSWLSIPLKGLTTLLSSP